MFVIINISSNLLQTLSSFLTNNLKCYVTKKWKKSRHVGNISVTSLKIDVIEKYFCIPKKKFNRKQQQQ